MRCAPDDLSSPSWQITLPRSLKLPSLSGPHTTTNKPIGCGGIRLFCLVPTPRRIRQMDRQTAKLTPASPKLQIKQKVRKNYEDKETEKAMVDTYVEMR